MKIGFREMIAAADAEVQSLGVADAARLQAEGSAILVDIRDIRELWRDGMVEGASHAPRGMLKFWFHPDSPYHKPEFAEDRKYILYCASGWRSALAAKALQDMGVPDVAHLDGGFSAWKDAGAPIVAKSKT